MNSIIELKNVSKVYESGETAFFALRDVDLEIPRGKLVVVLGPSGAGKSTLLNLIGGMDVPTTGEVWIDGKDIAELEEDQLSEYRAHSVGFIFQFYNILPTLTVQENVDIVKELVDDPMDSMAALREVGLADHAGKFPNQLSGGEQQRVSIARAIAKRPKLLLCDEPTGALDSRTGVEILKLLKKQCGEKNGENTVLIVTHNSLLAETADLVIRLKNGRVESVTENTDPKQIDEIQW